ncbi:hypothetical protein Taro_002334 [Colocasia esculenta]|uniref:Uncharacterized protein n=1 Tax=Colocasia esculenta TaxID=4460 RepID=A0A843TG69_COLES|nr:hypothetical protein [Colocasia esculenta]
MGTREGVTGLRVGLDEEAWKGEGDGGEGEVAAQTGMASCGRHDVPTREGEQRRDEPRREDQGEQQAPAPQGPVLPPLPPVDYGVFMQGLVQAMQTQAHTQAALQAQLEAQQAQERADVWWSSLLCTRFEGGAVEIGWDEFEGEMEQYLEEKKASQKRHVAPFHRQERNKAVFQSPQRPMASGGSQVPSQRFPSGQKECPHCGRAHGDYSREVSVERHQPQQQHQRQNDQGDLEPQLECLR